MEIRRLQLHHLPKVLEMEKQCFGEDAWSKQMVMSEFNSTMSVFFGAFDEQGTLAGYLNARFIFDECHINNVCTFPEFQRRGVATKMLNHLFEEGKKAGVPNFTLEVNTNNSGAIALYQKMKFQSVGVRKNYYHNTFDAMIMWRRI